jgi:hypothetical protein
MIHDVFPSENIIRVKAENDETVVLCATNGRVGKNSFWSTPQETRQYDRLRLMCQNKMKVDLKGIR